MKNIIAKILCISLLFCPSLFASESPYWEEYAKAKEARQVKSLVEYVSLLSNPQASADEGTPLYSTLSKSAQHKASALRWFHATGGKYGFRPATLDERETILKDSLIFVALVEKTQGLGQECDSLLSARRQFGIHEEKDNLTKYHLTWAQQVLSSTKIIADDQQTTSGAIQKHYQAYADTYDAIYPPKKTPISEKKWNRRLNNFVEEGITQELMKRVAEKATTLKLDAIAASISLQNIEVLKKTVLLACSKISEVSKTENSHHSTLFTASKFPLPPFLTTILLNSPGARQVFMRAYLAQSQMQLPSEQSEKIEEVLRIFAMRSSSVRQPAMSGSPTLSSDIPTTLSPKAKSAPTTPAKEADSKTSPSPKRSPFSALSSPFRAIYHMVFGNGSEQDDDSSEEESIAEDQSSGDSGARRSLFQGNG